jgi:hypothetical protein
MLMTLLAAPAARAAATVADGSHGIWMPVERLQTLPMTGAAWNQLKTAADRSPGQADIANLNSNHDVNTLAAALVYVRTGVDSYRQKVADAIAAAMASEKPGKYGALARARNIVAYVVAADLVDLDTFAPGLDARFRQWLTDLPSRRFTDGTIIENAEKRPNNHGTMAQAGRIAIAAYLGDTATLARAAAIFHGWLGDRSAYAGFNFSHGYSWHADPANPVGINPVGATAAGHSIDGALPEEMRRGCDFRWLPCYTHYPWEGLGGAYAAAQLLSRQGYDTWNWCDRALFRAVRFLYDLSRSDPVWWQPAARNDSWIVDVANYQYGPTFPAAAKGTPGKNMGWTSWTNAL